MRRWAALVAAVGILAGCSGGTDTAADEPTEPAEPADVATGDVAPAVDRSRTFRALVQVEGTGAAPFAWEGEQEIVLTRMGGPHLDVNVLSAGFTLPEILPDDRAHRFRWAFDLLNAYDDQPGTFTIDSQPDTPGLSSIAFLIWMKVKDPSKDAVFEEGEVEYLERFGEIRQPCTIEIGEGERTGGMTCPELANDDGEVAGLEVRWTALDS